MKKKWLIQNKHRVDGDWSDDRVLNLLLKNRGIKPADRVAFLNPVSPEKITVKQAGLTSSSISSAVKLIKKTKGRIVIYGDYDVDGISATAILWEALWKKGFNVWPHIPSRFEEGYGLNSESVVKLKEDNPDLELIITVDNGIVANQAVKTAKDLGIKVIVTDHHLAGKKLPPADVIIHSTKLSGAGVAWFLAQELGGDGLDLAALGTVADLLPLLGINRSLVVAGLKQLNKKSRLGLKVLSDLAGIGEKSLDAWLVSYVLSPRLNAAGRLETGLDALRLLCTNDLVKARKLAQSLEKINKERQTLTFDGFAQATKLAENQSENVIVITEEFFHQGIIGLIAGRLVEAFSKPALVLSCEGDLVKGSARSVTGCDLMALLGSGREFLIDLGGHPLAAGFTLKKEKLASFVVQVKKWAQKNLDSKLLAKELKIDCRIDLAVFNKKFYQLVQKMAPFGMGNPEPVFLVKGLRLVESRLLGKEGKHLKLFLDDPETKVVEKVSAEAIGFGLGDFDQQLKPGVLLDLVFTVDLNQWRGRETLQMKLKDLSLA
ncbi:MAG: single-stranded-DNA-specific exonuclease RecJ [Patescibacteria group bacterium]